MHNNRRRAAPSPPRGPEGRFPMGFYHRASGRICPAQPSTTLQRFPTILVQSISLSKTVWPRWSWLWISAPFAMSSEHGSLASYPVTFLDNMVQRCSPLAIPQVHKEAPGLSTSVTSRPDISPLCGKRKRCEHCHVLGVEIRTQR